MIQAIIFLNFIVCAIGVAHKIAKVPVWKKTIHDYIPVCVQIAMTISLAFGWYQDLSYIFNILVAELLITAMMIVVHNDIREASRDTQKGRNVRFAGDVYIEGYYIAIISTTIHAVLIVLYNYY